MKTRCIHGSNMCSRPIYWLGCIKRHFSMKIWYPKKRLQNAIMQSFIKILVYLVWWQVWNIDSYNISTKGSLWWNISDWQSIAETVIKEHLLNIWCVVALKTESHHDATFVITGDAVGCHYNDNLQCPWWQSWRYDNCRFMYYTYRLQSLPLANFENESLSYYRVLNVR